MAIPLHGPGLPAIAQAAQKAVQLFIENRFDGAADIRPQPVLDRVKAVVTCSSGCALASVILFMALGPRF
mgnify:CR=1 FL=1